MSGQQRMPEPNLDHTPGPQYIDGAAARLAERLRAVAWAGNEYDFMERVITVQNEATDALRRGQVTWKEWYRLSEIAAERKAEGRQLAAEPDFPFPEAVSK